MTSNIKRAGILLAAMIMVIAGPISARAKIVEKAVRYSSHGLTMVGYLAYDSSIKEKRPAVLVVPEWWGLNDYAKMRTRMLAKLGYVAMAADMYGSGKVVNTPAAASKLSSTVIKHFDRDESRFLAAINTLKKQKYVDPNRIAAIGYCFGGDVVLAAASRGAALKGVVSFHGELDAIQSAKPGTIKAKILVLNGADDKFITADAIAAFKKKMDDAGADYRFINYPGAVHSFTNPAATALGKKFKLPLAYDKAADQESWSAMEQFLKSVFGA